MGKGDSARRALLDFAFAQIRTKDDEGFQVLCAHQVAESLLQELLDFHLANPRALDNARLSFFQPVAVAESMGLPGGKPWLWDALRKLNSLRNDFSHRLSRDRKEATRGAFIGSTEPWLYPPPQLTGPEQFEIRLFLLCGQLANMRHGRDAAGPDASGES